MRRGRDEGVRGDEEERRTKRKDERKERRGIERGLEG